MSRQHLVKKGAFWAKGATAVSHAYLQYKRLTDDEVHQKLKTFESVESGLVLVPAKRSQIMLQLDMTQLQLQDTHRGKERSDIDDYHRSHFKGSIAGQASSLSN